MQTKHLPRFWIVTFLVIVMVIGGLVLNRFVSDRSPSKDPVSQATSTSSPQFAGSEACAKCHKDIADQFASHPMALSTRRIQNDAKPPAELPAYINGKQRVLKVALDDETITHFEQMYDEAGKLIYEQKHPLTYVIGSGRRAKAYVEHRGSLLFMSPVNWYRESNSWNLAPGYALDDIRRFDRRITDDCLACHAGKVASKDNRPSVYENPPFHEMAIGCERCHGPAADHIAFRKSNRSGKEDPIVNPASLDSEHREAVCYQCHLEAAARVLRPNKTHLDFRAGMSLTDVWAILDQGLDFTPDGHTRSVNHVQQMRDSKCFKDSDGKLGCISCHDPHRVPSVEQRAEFYRTKCFTCHQSQSCTAPNALRQEKQDDCTVCHMPKLDSKNMSHVVQTDHRVLRKAAAETPNSGGTKAMSLNYFADSASSFSPEERQRGLILGTIIHCKRKGIPIPESITIPLERLLQNFPQDVAALNDLGSLALQRNDLAGARNYFERAVAANSRNEAALDGLLDATYAMSDWETSVKVATELLEIDSSSARVAAMLGDALTNLGRVDEGIAAIRKAVALNPGAAILHEWLVKKYSETGATELMKAESEMVERLRAAKIPANTEDLQ